MNRDQKIDALLKACTFDKAKKTLDKIEVRSIIGEEITVGIGLEGQKLSLVRNCGSYGKQSAIQQQPIRDTNGAIYIKVPGRNCPQDNISAQDLYYAYSDGNNCRRLGIAAGMNIGYVIDSTIIGNPSIVSELPIIVMVGADVKEVYKK